MSCCITEQEPCVHQQEPPADVPSSIQDSLAGGGPVPSAATGTTQDLDMSQICKALDQDFTQMTEVVKKTQDLFSPSTCLLLVKERNKKILTNGEASRRETGCPHTNKGPELTGYQSNSCVAPNCSIQSCATNLPKLSLMSSTVPSIVHKQLFHGPNSKGTEQRLVPFTPLSEEKERSLYDEMEEDPTKLNQSVQSHSISGIGPMIEEFIGPQGDLGGDVITDGYSEGQTTMMEGYGLGFPPSTSGSSGFKTASNKGIPISSVNLKKARDIFKDVEEESFANVPLTRNDTTRNQITRSDMNKSIIQNDVSISAIPASALASVSAVLSAKSVDNQHRLTASQKADVSELCSLLEETHTQFDFTPFKPANLNIVPQEVDLSPKATDAELDPDFLAGIDFDDSFSSDAEKHLKENFQIPLGSSNHMVSTLDNESVFLLKRNETSTHINVSNAIKRKSTLKAVDVSNGFENNITSYTETPNHQEKYPLKCNLGFQTAGGKTFSVSKKCLSKAKALFSDLEDSYLPFTDIADSPCHESVNSGTASTHQQIPDRNTPKSASVVGTANNFRPEFTDSNSVNSIEKVSITVAESCFFPGILNDKLTAEKPGCESSKLHMTKVGELKRGFSTASGRGIPISAKAFQAASSFFSDLDAIENQGGAPPQQQKCNDMDNTVMGNKKESDIPDRNTPKSASVVGTANNFRPEFTDSNSVNSIEKVSITVAESCFFPGILNDKLTAEKPGCESSKLHMTKVGELKRGFSTASGRGIPISAKAFQAASSFFSDLDAIENQGGAPPQQRKCNDMDNTVIGNKKESDCSFKKETFTEPEQKYGEIASTSAVPSAYLATKSDDDNQTYGFGGFKKPMVNDVVSIPRRAPLKEQSGSFSSDSATLVVGSYCHGGFSTASGKKVSVTGEALARAKNLLNECALVEEEKRNIDASPALSLPGPSPKMIVLSRVL